MKFLWIKIKGMDTGEIDLGIFNKDRPCLTGLSYKFLECFNVDDIIRVRREIFVDENLKDVGFGCS